MQLGTNFKGIQYEYNIHIIIYIARMNAIYDIYTHLYTHPKENECINETIL